MLKNSSSDVMTVMYTIAFDFAVFDVFEALWRLCFAKLSTLQIPNSHYEKKKKYSKWAHNCSFWVFFSCHYSKTFWLAENLNEIKISHYGKIFSHIKQNFSFWESVGNTKYFFVSLRLPLFSPRYIALKLNQKIITKISNHLI